MTTFTADRKKDIMRRAQQYADGELSLEDFMLLEQVDNEFMEEDEEVQEPQPSVAEQLKALYEEEKRQEEQAKMPPAEKVLKGKEYTLTYEEWSALNIAEQSELYYAHPEEVGKLIRGTAKSISYKDADRKIPRYTLEEFRAMSLTELNDLYIHDNEQYMELSAASSAEGNGEE